LEKLKDNQLVLDWRKKQKSRSGVRIAIWEVISKELSEEYSVEDQNYYVDQIYQHVYDNYYGEGRSVYTNIN
jgi:type I restriction enzyme R subunit